MAQHRAVLAPETATVRPPGVRSGPIAILPEDSAVFADAVAEAGGQVAELSEHTRGLIWLSYARAAELGDVLAAHPQLAWVQLPWAGIDAFSDVLTAHRRDDLLVTSAKGAFAQPVAEHALALALASLRVLPERARARSWNAVPAGESLYGRTVLIIGAGGIARELIRLLGPFASETVVVRRSTDPVPGATRTVTTQALRNELPLADVVVVAAALTGDTRHLLGAAELGLMKKTAHLVNIARGPLVDTDALVEALRSGTIAGAALDVTDPEPLPQGHALWTEARCLITPHMADTPEMTAPLLAERIRLNVAAFLGNGPFVGVVDTESGY
ncbi:NAD(P)-dependent oxidoreductase [Cryobacterium arcticum]|uniref:4-phosphoerythronate dehydrogenase n=1 Tax=Cryobacterium arcticum TaxID=670052 RepID=A0A1B1BJD0_9MICO|nr:NAD(P)-dependent oxidoreductase [Cryobacterium arcticum]ANP72616.1 4-phosphoerythronate dehydrogenase [Cryobacterium arcticum]